MIIGIIGSRRRNLPEDFQKIRKAFFRKYLEGDRIVSGGCKEGGDQFADEIARQYGIPIITHYPNRSALDKTLPVRVAYARINYARNASVARDADALIACVAPDRKGGTEDTIRRFCRKHKETEEQLVKEGLLILV